MLILGWKLLGMNAYLVENLHFSFCASSDRGDEDGSQADMGCFSPALGMIAHP